MKNSVKKVIFISSGLLIITFLFFSTKISLGNVANIHGKKFGDWVVECSKNEQSKDEICILTQQVTIKQNDQQKPIALFQIGYFGPKKELKLIQTLPLGIRLDSGTSVISQKKLIAPGKFVTCTTNGCQSVSLLSEEDLSSINSTTENFVAFMGLDEKQTTLPISTKGLKEGLKNIR